MWSRGHVLRIGAPLLTLLAAAGTAAAEESERVARVTYFTGSTIYLDAGRAEGIVSGLELTFLRDGEVVAVCRVEEISTHKASCAVERKLLVPVVGDAASFVAAAPTEREPRPPQGVQARTSRTERRAGLRGRIGVGYLFVRDRTTATASYSRPALDLRLDGTRIGNTPWGLNVDARTRRTTRHRDDGASESTDETKVYRAAVSYRGSEGWNLTVGRQFSPALSAVSVFDGVSGELVGRRLTTGLFSGTQPDPTDYSFSSDLREHGVYLAVHAVPGARRQWEVSSGLIGSYEKSEINREFLYLQGRYGGRRLTAYATQEIDFNRDWKSEVEGSSLSMTSTFASVNVRATDRLSLRGGYDNRRSVRLYRDFVNPETEFDDSFREGVWGGVTTRIARRFSLGVDGRSNDGGSAGSSTAYTLTLGARGLARFLDLRTRSTSYDNASASGWLHSVTAGLHAGRLARFELGGGVRRERQLSATRPDEDLAWIDASIDLALGRHWYWIVTADLLRGELEDVDQYYSRITYRF